MNRYKYIRNGILIISILLIITSFIGCSGETTSSRESSQRVSIRVVGNPVLLVEPSISSAAEQDAYAFDLVGEYRFQVLEGNELRNEFITWKEANNFGISIEGVAESIRLSDDNIAKKEKSLTFVYGKNSKTSVKCPIEIVNPGISVEGSPIIVVSQKSGSSYVFQSVGGNFRIDLTYPLQGVQSFSKWCDATDKGITAVLNETVLEDNVTIELEDTNPKSVSFLHSDEKAQADCSVSVHQAPKVTSFTVVKAPSIAIDNLPDYSTMVGSATVDCAIQDFEINAVWNDPIYDYDIKTLEAASKWGFKFNQIVENKISLTKENVINQKVALTVTNTAINVTSPAFECDIKAKNIPEKMTGFSIVSVPTICLDRLPNFSAANSFTLKGDFKIEAYYDQEPKTREFNGVSEIIDNGFDISSLTNSAISISKDEYDGASKSLNIENTRWDKVVNKAFPITVREIEVKLLYGDDEVKLSKPAGYTFTEEEAKSVLGVSVPVRYFTDKDANNQASFPIVPLNNTDLYIRNLYTVSFKTYYGMELASQSVVAGKTLSEKPNINAKYNYYSEDDKKITNILTYPFNSDTTITVRADCTLTLYYGTDVYTRTVREGDEFSYTKELADFKVYGKYPNAKPTDTICRWSHGTPYGNFIPNPVQISGNTTLYADKYGYASDEYKRVLVSNITEFKNAIMNLEDKTVIIMQAGTYEYGATMTTVKTVPSAWSDAQAWANQVPFCILNNDVAIIGDGKVRIQATGYSSSAGLFGILGNNVMLQNLSIGTIGGGKSVEVIAEGGTIINSCTLDGDIYVDGKKYANTNSNMPQVKDIIIGSNTFNRYLTLTNGVSGNIAILNNTFSSTGKFNLLGIRDSGWNFYGVDLSNMQLKGNKFEAGSVLYFKDKYSSNIEQYKSYINPSSLGFTNYATSTDSYGATVHTYTHP